MALNPTRRPFTVIEYHQMAQAGILNEDERVELLDGEVIYMTPFGSRHAAGVARLTKLFIPMVGERAIVWAQNPVDISERSEPQPDVALLRNQPDYYDAGHPTSEDVLLLIEVGDTTADVDRRFKVPLYCQSGISEVWLVDVDQKTVTIYRDPANDGYRTVRVARRGEQISPEAFPDSKVAVTDILG